jgi:hypothetical protein
LRDPEFVNAAAEQCSARCTAFGERFVRYRGSDYALIGLFLVPTPRRRSALFFVLRSIDGGNAAPVPIRAARERGRLRPAGISRTFVNALMAAMLLALLPWGGPKTPVAAPPRAAFDHGIVQTAPGAAAPARSAILGSSTAARNGTAHPRVYVAPGAGHEARVGRHGQSRRRAASTLRSAVKPQARSAPSYAVSFGDFSDRGQAEAAARVVRSKGYRAFIMPAANRVRVRGHRYPTRASAVRMARIFRELGLRARLEVVRATRIVDTAGQWVSPSASSWCGPPYCTLG